MIETLTGPDSFTIKADGQLTVRETGTVKDYLVEALERYREIVVDLSEIESIDLACLQLLYCAKQLANESKRRPVFKVILPPDFKKNLAVSRV